MADEFILAEGATDRAKRMKPYVIEGKLPFKLEVFAESEDEAHAKLEHMKVSDWIEDAYTDMVELEVYVAGEKPEATEL